MVKIKNKMSKELLSMSNGPRPIEWGTKNKTNFKSGNLREQVLALIEPTNHEIILSCFTDMYIFTCF